MRKPKILFVLHLPPPMHGAAMMGKYLMESAVINTDFDAHFINLATNKILSQSGKGSFKKLFTFITLIKQLISVLKKNKFDLCYMTLTSSGAGFYKDAIIVSVIKHWNQNIIYHFHNKGVSLPKNRLADALYKYVFHNTKTILLSKYLYPDIRQYVAEQNVFYCPNGIPFSGLPLDYQIKGKIKAESACQLLFLSNMMREKGVFTLLEACLLLKEEGHSFACHFVGGWMNITEAEFKDEINRKNLADVVFAYGPKYGAEKEAFYKEADVFVFPTFYDVFPLVCLEAMQYSMAVVATPEGGVPEIVVDEVTGFIVPQHDAKTLAQKLALLIEDKALRKDMQRKGKERFDELFTLDKWEHNMSSILTKASNIN